MKSKEWRIGVVACVVVVVVVGTRNSYVEATKTLKLPHYDIKFGTWPLMEVSKRSRGGRSFGKGGYNKRPGPGPGSGKGFGPGKGFNPGNGFKSGSGFSPASGFNPGSGFRPGPPPGNLVSFNAARENRGTIHKHLQETLKMYAATKTPLNSGNLPIIVRAPGPYAPPPPPGYILGPPSPTSFVARPAPTVDNGPPRPSRLQSMLTHAAYSGMFKDTVDTYIANDFNPGPSPPSGTYVSVLPDGTQVDTYVGNDFQSIPRLPNSIEPKPSTPPVLEIGGPLPDNYTVKYAQRSVVAVKAPDPFEKTGIANPNANEYEVGFDVGTKYEQGYGAKPPPSHPIVITKFQKRGEAHAHPEKIVDQDLPDQGLIVTTNVVYASPNISAPLGGRTSEPFKEGLRDKKKIEKSRKKEQPLDAQVKLLGRLFTKLQRLKPPKVAIPEEEADEGKFVEVGGGWGEGESFGDWKYVAKSKVDSPIMAVQVQTWSAPEISSADPDIIESMAEFGKHDVKFGETDEIVNLMETAMNQQASRIPIRELGSNPEEANENMLNWIRRHLTIVRDVNGDAHAKGEQIASDQFKQYQQILTPPFNNNGWAPGQPMPYDPKVGSRSFSETSSAAVNKYNPPPPPI